MATQTSDHGPGDSVVPPDDGEGKRRHAPGVAVAGRKRAVVVGAVITVAVAGALTAFVIKPWQPPAQAAGAQQNVSTAAVERADVSTLVTEQGTLGYQARSDGSDYQVVNWGTGVYTWLPAVGAKVGCGQTAYSINGMPVVLLCGTTPLYRDMSLGMSGSDVRQLNKNLVALGYARTSLVQGSWNSFGSETERALKKFQAKLKVTQTGRLNRANAVVAEKELRVTKVSAPLGTRATPGAPVVSGTSTSRQVTVNLDVTRQSQVSVGDKTRVVLPDNSVAHGKVARIGSVAAANGQSGSGSVTVPVYLSLDTGKALSPLDRAPVRVEIITEGARHVLVVPVTALLGQGQGGFAVEKVTDGSRNMVPVKLGLFDTDSGRVEVSGDLREGDRVVVPTS